MNAYHDHYRDLRDEILYNITKKADKLANQSNNGLLIAIPKYFESIVGFFTIESILRKSVEVSDGVFSPIDITNLWEQIYKHINTLLQDLCITLVSPDELLYIKEEILLLIEVLSDEAYNLNIVPLYDIISNLYMIFQQLQMTNIIKLCSHTLDHCSYQPFYVTTQETFLEKIRAYRLEFIDIDDSNNSNHRHDDNSKLSRSQAIAARELVVANKEIAAANLDALEEELNNGLMNYDRGLAKSNSSGGWKDFNDENVSAKSGNGTSSKTSRDRRRSNSPMRLTKLQVQSFVAQTFPFSEAVTILMKQLHLFVVRFFIFAVRNNRLSSQADSVCGSLCQAITTISGMLIKELRNGGSDMPLSKVCQISIDAATISSASDTLWIITENALEQFHWIDETGTFLIYLLISAEISFV